jgi:hypothetical protein
MPSSLKAMGAGFALSIVLLSLATVASAGPKEDVAAAASTWAVALGEDDPDKVLPLYSDDAVFWGTLSPTVRADRAALRDYFVTAFKVLPGLKVAFGDQLIRVSVRVNPAPLAIPRRARKDPSGRDAIDQAEPQGKIATGGHGQRDHSPGRSQRKIPPFPAGFSFLGLGDLLCPVTGTNL